MKRLLTALALLLATTAHAGTMTNFQTMWGGPGARGYGAPPAQALVLPYQLSIGPDGTFCAADYDGRALTCVQQGMLGPVVMPLAQWPVEHPLGVWRGVQRTYVSTDAGKVYAVDNNSGFVKLLPANPGLGIVALTGGDGHVYGVDREGSGTRHSQVWRWLESNLDALPELVIPTAAGLLEAHGAFLRGSTLYLSDTASQRIVKAALPFNGFQTVAGQQMLIPNGNGSWGVMGIGADGVAALGSPMGFPMQLYVAADGSVYYTELVNNRARVIDAGGTVRTIMGNGSMNSAHKVPAPGQDALTFPVSNPNGLVVDERPLQPVVYVASGFDQAIRQGMLATGTVATATVAPVVTATAAQPPTQTSTVAPTQTASATRTPTSPPRPCAPAETPCVPAV